MLKEAVRRLLWLGPTLLVVTLPIFWGVARATDLVQSAPVSALPLFFNSNPEGVRERALAALALVAAGADGASDGAETLARLGGAALPHVLARFDALGPDARGRVALALAPVARRMGIGGSELDTPEAAVVLWNRFWEEHAIDFRPAVVRRTVRRFVEHPSALRASEVSELDTVALEDLMDAIGTVHSADDAARVRHIAELAARMTDKPWSVPADAPPAAAARVADLWKHWWLGAESTYVAFTGPRRLVATVLETRYAQWLAELARRTTTSSTGGGRMASEIRTRGPTTLLLLLSGLFAGYPLAVLGGVLAAMRAPRARDLLASGAGLVVATTGVVGTAAVLGGSGLPRLLGACAAVAVGTAAGSFRHRKTLSRRTFELCHVRTERAFGAPPLRVALRTLRLSAAAAAALAVADVSGLMTSALVAEHVFSLRGIGEITARALRSGDQTWLLTIAVLGTVTVGVAQIAADLLLFTLDPRVRAAVPRAAKQGP